jgi:hypothetical protein
VFTQFSNFREEEFKQRLHEKLFSTLKLLVEVDEIDKNTLEIIDKNAINSLYNEKVFIFDDNYNILYKSKTTKDIHININDLKKLKTNKYVYTKKGFLSSTNKCNTLAFFIWVYTHIKKAKNRKLCVAYDSKILSS